MHRWLNVDDLIDAQKAAEALDLAYRGTVSNYQTRYPAMPRPVVDVDLDLDLGRGQPMLWLRPTSNAGTPPPLLRAELISVVATRGKCRPPGALPLQKGC